MWYDYSIEDFLYKEGEDFFGSKARLTIIFYFSSERVITISLTYYVEMGNKNKITYCGRYVCIILTKRNIM